MIKKHYVAFDFGENWLNFVQSSLTEKRIDKARESFVQLLSFTEESDGEFLDIGFGQGLSMLFASELGYRVTGIDINDKCLLALEKLQSLVHGSTLPHSRVLVGSILDEAMIKKLKTIQSDGFDIVHSWGVLHHTGDMRSAFSNSAKLVKPGGFFIVAIYKRHWSSPIWKAVKYSYCSVPKVIKKMFIVVFMPIMYLRILIARGVGVASDDRGMEFYFDLVDWLGGYPYEYTDEETLTEWGLQEELSIIKIVRNSGWTGCNEYIFRRKLPMGHTG